MSNLTEIENQVETRFAQREPELELVAVEAAGRGSLRILVDHPEGVNLAVCERATEYLSDMLEQWSLEVSSPGVERPLTKPEHYRRFLGRKVRIRTHRQIDGQRNFTGELAGADAESVVVDTGGDSLRIPLTEVQRSNLVPDIQKQGGAA